MLFELLQRLLAPVWVRLALGMLATLPLAVAPAAGAGSLSLDVRAGAGYDSNVGNAERDDEQEEDMVSDLNAIGGYRFPVNDISGLILKAGLETRLHADLTDLNSLTAMASASYLVQPWRGFSAPWFALFGEFRWRHHADSEIRDGTIRNVGLTVGQQVTDRVSGQLRFEVVDRDADRGRAFEFTQRILSVAVDHRTTDRLTTYLTYHYVKDGLVTTARPSLKFRDFRRAATMDPAFGRGKVAWRLGGHVHSFGLGGRYTLAERTALDGKVSYSNARADNDNQWRVWRAGLALVHRF